MSDHDTLTGLAGITHNLNSAGVARLVINGNRILASETIPGLEIDARETKDGVDLKVVVRKGTVIEKPVHLCFGVLHKRFDQHIRLRATIEKDAQISIFGHCVFPNATEVKHTMDGEITVGENAAYNYFERHIHSDTGGVKVYPKAKITIGKNARFKTEFELLKGRVGLIDIDYQAKAMENSRVDVISRVSGTKDDIIRINEGAVLEGGYATAVLRSRVAVRDTAKADVVNKIIAKGAYSRGHVDCTEILQGKGIVKAIPEVEVLHPKARVTHEAKLGGVDNRQLETLMSRGLSEKEAEEMIINGLLS